MTEGVFGPLDGRVAVVSGAGRGLGRQHALLLAAEGARVVVNDSGGEPDGSDHDAEPARQVVEEICAAGGQAVASDHDVADWDGGRQLVELALETFGDLHVLVNNAGILRDRFLVNMTADEWDDVVRVHLRGHFVPTRFAAAYWRDRAKSGQPVLGSVVNTTSTSGLLGNAGQSNYGAAKAGVAAFTLVVAAELDRYGVRANAVAPMARTRLTEATPGLAEVVRPPDDLSAFDDWDPANVAPLVAWLSSESCPVTGKVFLVHGGKVALFEPWTVGRSIDKGRRWTLAELDAEMATLLT